MRIYFARRILSTDGEKLMNKPKILEFKRFAVHDGDGIRTTVFFKGCPLKCVWCHNPEGISPKAELGYFSHKCVGCGECAKVCDCHTVTEGIHTFDREKCVQCGKCVQVCPAEALKLYGEDIEIEKIVDILSEDIEFYKNSGGGVTLSGGECLLFPEFCAEILRRCKERGINTAVDTCGYVKREAIDAVMPHTDVFLYDIKAYDEDCHIRCTGHSNKIILENIKYIDSQDKNIEVRIPYVPEYNEDQIEKIAAFLSELKNVVKVKILPYHDYARSKYLALGMCDSLPTVLPAKEQTEKYQKIFSL